MKNNVEMKTATAINNCYSTLEMFDRKPSDVKFYFNLTILLIACRDLQ